MDNKNKIIIGACLSNGEYLSSGVITIPEGCTGVVVDGESVIHKDIMDTEKQRGIAIIVQPNNIKRKLITFAKNTIKSVERIINFYRVEEDTPIEKDYPSTIYKNVDSITFTGTSTKTLCDNTGTYTITCTISNDDYLGENPIQERFLQQSMRKLDQKQCFEFHNTIYGNKFRQAKHTSKHAHIALKQNTRRIRNNGMIKNRIHNYNKPATL